MIRMGIRAIIVLIIFTSCQKPETHRVITYHESCGVVDIAYNETDVNYIEQQFRLDACTFDLDFSNYTINWQFSREITSAGCAATLFDSNATIVLNEYIWNSASYDNRVELVYHELGHAWLNYCHSDNIVCNPSGKYRSNDIMKGTGYSSDFVKGRSYFFLEIDQHKFPEGTAQPECKNITK